MESVYIVLQSAPWFGQKHGGLFFFLATPRSLRDKGGCHSYGCLEWHFYTMRSADSVGNDDVA